MAEKAKKAPAPASIPVGEVIHNTLPRRKWLIGPSIATGGFGEIYSACEHIISSTNEFSSTNESNYPLVLKIKPYENRPLVVEKNFYIRYATQLKISRYMKLKKLNSLGMPSYFGNGFHIYKGEKFRYLVLERYGKDIWSLFKESGRSFQPATVFQLGLQMLEVLEFIHSQGYVHADIKGANIVMGLRKGTENQAYLVDFGLVTRVNEMEFKPNPKFAHNGTIEYTSRDAHQGVPSMRGDLEILGYNMLQWLVGELPWEKSLEAPMTVQSMKEAFMKDVRSNITKQYSNVPDAMIKFLEYINTLKPEDVPDNTKCRKLFGSYLRTQGKTRYSKLDFSPSEKGKTTNKPVGDEDDADDDAGKKQKANGVEPKVVRRGRRPKAKEVIPEPDTGKEAKDSIDEKTPQDKSNDVVLSKRSIRKESSPKVKKGRKPKVKETSSERENGENEEPDQSTEVKVSKKRKSLGPVHVVKVKKAKFAPKATPAKKNHANIATQTSDRKRSPRQVSCDGPSGEMIAEKNPLNLLKESVNSSGDMLHESFTIEVKREKPKKMLLSDEEVVIKRIVTRKVATVKPKARSYKDCLTIVNGSK